MSVQLADMPELNRKAFDVLSQALGIGDTVRFFSQLGPGAGNYVEERRQLFAGLTMDEYRAAVAPRNGQDAAASVKADGPSME